jgi:hypothetical protein
MHARLLRGGLEQGQPLMLAQGEALLLSRSLDPSALIRLEIESGVGRISASFGEAWPDITLAFCSRNEPEWLRFPPGGFSQIEALTEMRLRMHHLTTGQQGPTDRAWPIELSGQELIAEWLLDLHLVRQPIGSDARLAALLRLLVQRFGLRTALGYQLPFTLAHARIAELICATRSTVTRQLVLLRQTGQIMQEEGSGRLLLVPAFVDGGPEPRSR